MQGFPAVIAAVLCWIPPAFAQAPLTSGRAAAHPWKMRNATAARTGQSDAPGATAGQLQWSFHVAGYVPQIAVADDGSIYLGTVFNENDWSNETYVYALTAAGAVKWRAKVRPYDWGAAQDSLGGPALDSGGNLINPSTYTQLLKMTPQGDTVWIVQGSPQALIYGSPATLPDDTIRHTMFPQRLIAIAPDSATLFTGPAFNAAANVAVHTNGEMALGGLRTQEPHGSVDIQYFNADGTLRWQKTSTHGAQGTPIFGPDGTVFAPFLGKAFNPDGSVKWTTDVASFAAALGNNGVLYFPSNGVVAVDSSTGVRLWTLPLPGLMQPEPAIDAAGNVFVTSQDGTLYSVSPAGTLNWSLKACDKFLRGPVVGPGGSVLAPGLIGYDKFVFSVR
jgi:outer membrane protein assembly factor BamB